MYKCVGECQQDVLSVGGDDYGYSILIGWRLEMTYCVGENFHKSINV